MPQGHLCLQKHLGTVIQAAALVNKLPLQISPCEGSFFKQSQHLALDQWF